MIPLHKLERLPRHQRLRKMAKLLSFEDAALARGESLTVTRLDQLRGVSSALRRDGDFSPDERAVVAAAAAEIEAAVLEGRAPSRRPVNDLRHLVQSVIGKQEADWDFVDDSGRLSSSARRVLPGVTLFLEDLRSPFNVGSIFRVAESFGVEVVLLSSLCASPDHPRAARSAMGCTESVRWERSSLDTLDGPLFALETGGTPLEDFDFPNRGTLIVGSEELGVSPGGLARAEASSGRVSIPTIGAKGSLNVAVAVGIVMHRWCAGLVSGPAGSPI